MARNKHPEITVKRILDASLKLFLEKGYDHTTIQDIVDELGDLSKGAIYHHFKSKEEIIEAAAALLFTDLDDAVHQLMQSPDGTALERLHQIFMTNLLNPGQERLLAAAPNLMKNPRFLADQLRSCLTEMAPMVEKQIRRGMEDGSIPAEHPRELAEISSLLISIWLNPAIFTYSAQGLRERYAYLQNLLAGLGFPILDESIGEQFMRYQNLLSPPSD